MLPGKLGNPQTARNGNWRKLAEIGAKILLEGSFVLVFGKWLPRVFKCASAWGLLKVSTACRLGGCLRFLLAYCLQEHVVAEVHQFACFCWHLCVCIASGAWRCGCRHQFVCAIK